MTTATNKQQLVLKSHFVPPDEVEVEVLTPLDKAGEAKRAKLETIIDKNLQSFVDAGMALWTIRDERLYRSTHKSFGDYCRQRWGLSKTHANRLIASSEVVSNIADVGPAPLTEGAVRPLTLLPLEEQKRVWAKVIELSPDPKSVTANMVTRVINETTNKPRRGTGTRKPGRPSLDMLPRQMVLNNIEAWAVKERDSLRRAPFDRVIASVLDLIRKL